MAFVPKPTLKSLADLHFDNSALRSLPIDPVKENYVRRQVKGTCFSYVEPTPVTNPKLVAASTDALELLDLDPKVVEDPLFLKCFSGCEKLPGSETAAHCYCGHQFGHFAGQLGDGRAMYLGEVVNHDGDRWELQLKGAGRTPYSRDGDGRAVLRSSIREFLCSEAMHALGIPTTRAGSCITSDTYVVRDLRYDGNPKRERATVVLRLAPTFLRFGSFQVVIAQDPTTGRPGSSTGRADILKSLLDYTIKYHYPTLMALHTEDTERYVSLYREMVYRTALMVAEWQCVGFTHGVMNTDNMSVLGLTIDYGPFGFLDSYDPTFIANGSDNQGRYAFGQQPSVCQFNLARLAEALSLVVPHEMLTPELDKYKGIYETAFMSKMRKKLGLKKEEAQDKGLVDELTQTLADTAADYTNVIRSLNRVSIPAEFPTELPADFVDLRQHILTQLAPVATLCKAQKPSMDTQQVESMLQLAKSQPAILSMFGMTLSQLEMEAHKIKRYEELADVCDAKKALNDSNKWTKWLVRYAQRLHYEISGAAKADLPSLVTARRVLMNSNNPVVVLRNWIAQEAIAKAEEGNYNVTNDLLRVLRHPYEDPEAHPAGDISHWTQRVPEWASELCMTCSS